MMKRIIVLAMMGGLVLLLAGAAFLGSRMLRSESLQIPSGMAIPFGFNAGGAGGCDISRIPSPELPGPPMMRRAVLVRQDGNSIFIEVPMRSLSVDRSGAVIQNASTAGPIVEVVVTHDTKVYQDVTFQRNPPACGQVQEILAPGNLSEITADTTFLVWGRQSGGRVLATDLVYELPVFHKTAAGR